MNHHKSIKVLGSLDSRGVTTIPKLLSIDWTEYSQELLGEGQEIRKGIPPDPGLGKEDSPPLQKTHETPPDL